MKDAIRRTLLYTIERILVRGAHYRFLFVVAAIGIVSIVGGLLLILDPQAAEGPGEAMWWAFLRLSDPGYLGDDQGTWRRVVSTVITVLGYVIFLGAMVAILTQWLNETLNRLEQGRTPIRQSGHIAILGWTNRTRTICRELVNAEGRLTRWLERSGVRRLKVAILAAEGGPERDYELQMALGPLYRRQQFVLRSGSYLRASHLRRVDLGHAASIVLPGIESTAADAASHDAMVIKTLSAISAEYGPVEDLPPCVCEIFDPRKIPVAARAYGGSVSVLASDVIIGRLICESFRQPGSSDVLNELLTDGEGATLYVRIWEAGPTTVGQIEPVGRDALFIGITTGGAFRLAPPADTPIDSEDGLVFVAAAYDDTELKTGASPTSPPQPAATSCVELEPMGKGSRVLVLGWSRRMPDVLGQLEHALGDPWSVDVLSAVAPEQRLADIAEHGVSLERTVLKHTVGDLTVPDNLAKMEPGKYDRVFLVASDWPVTGDAADARTISTYIALTGLLEGNAAPPHMLVELAYEGNVELVDAGRTEVVVSPRVLSRLLARVVLRPQLSFVIDEVFGQGSTQLRFAGVRSERSRPFGELAAELRARRIVVLGLRRGGLGGELLLAPNPELLVDCTGKDALIVLDDGDVRETTGAA